MEWRSQGLCSKCGRRLPVSTPSYHRTGFAYEGHEKCGKDVFRYRTAPPEPFNRLYPVTCVSRYLGGQEAYIFRLITGADIEHKILSLGGRENKCITFEEILRRSADCIAKPVWKGYGPFIATSRNRVFRRLDDVERLCFLDSGMFRTLWKHQEKEKS